MRASPSDAWMNKVDRFSKQFDKLDFVELGDYCRRIEVAFQGLIDVIEAKLPVVS